MAGINLEGDDLREFPQKVMEVLEPTPIKWLRIHPLPTRSLDEKGANGVSYLDAIDLACKSGYNILAPIDVGYKEVVKSIELETMDAFIEDSYDHSFKAAKQLTEVAQKHGVELMFGIENEIDMKSWVLQSLP